jgi:3-deoxy-D-manno-octulosonate 8-phosphate phosphatase KdsC-like HAD superfamily phosphatase
MSDSRSEARTRARRLRLMAFDVDGVLSDGSLFYSDEGIESRPSTRSTALA